MTIRKLTHRRARRMRATILFAPMIGSGLMAALPAGAQVPTPEPQAHPGQSTELPPVSVDTETGDGGTLVEPLTQSTLDADERLSARLATSDTATALTLEPGVAVNSAGGFSGLPSVRGLSGQRLNIMVDGVTIDNACPNAMMPPLSYTDPQTLSSLSVITGVSSVSAGGDSIGGVIRAVTLDPQFADEGSTRFAGEASAVYRTNHHGVSTGGKLSYATDRLAIAYAGSFTRSRDYRGGHHIGKVRSTEYKKTDQMLALSLKQGPHQLSVQSGFQIAPYEGFPNQWMDMTRNRSWFTNGQYLGTFSWGQVEVRGHYRRVHHKMDFLSDKRGTEGAEMPMITHGATAGGSAMVTIPVSSKDEVKFGSEYHHQRLNDYWPPVADSMMMGPDRYINLNHAHRNRLGAYGEWHRGWSDQWSTLVGVRLDHWSMNTGDVHPYGVNMMQRDDVMAAKAFNAQSHRRRNTLVGGSALVRYRPVSPVTLELGYAHKTRAPDLYERYAWGRGSMSSQMIGWYGDGNGYVGNLHLKPEQADTISLAGRYQGEGRHPWSIRIAPFYTHVHNFIDVVKLRDFTDMMGQKTDFVQLQFANQTARFYGLDAEARVQAWDDSRFGKGVVTAVFSWVNGRNQTRNTPLYHQMPVNGRLTLDHSLGRWQSAIDLVLVARKHRVDSVRNEPRTKGYALINLRTGYDLGPAVLTVEVENLFNRRYRLPLGGQSLGDYVATGQLRPLAGRGRSANIGLKVAF